MLLDFTSIQFFGDFFLLQKLTRKMFVPNFGRRKNTGERVVKRIKLIGDGVSSEDKLSLDKTQSRIFFVFFDPMGISP
jgi:hypothetical protein